MGSLAPLTGCIVALAIGSGAIAGESRLRVTDRTTREVKGVGSTGAVALGDPGGAATAGTRRGWPELAARVSGSECVVSADPAVYARNGGPADRIVDPCGRFDPGLAADVPQAAASAGLPLLTIDRMTTRADYYSSTYTPANGIALLGSANIYTLSDGTTWQSGAGTSYRYTTGVERVEVAGGSIRYFLYTPPYSGRVYRQTDYDSGDHSSQGTLAASGPLVLEAKAGEATAVMRGYVVIVDNEPTWYGYPKFHHFSAIVGAIVPFELTYTLVDGHTWQPDTLSQSFSYTAAGLVDFTAPLSVPRAVELVIGGPSEVPAGVSVQFSATVRYENDVRKRVTTTSAWSVAPSSLASVAAGLLTVPRVESPTTVTLQAAYAEGSATLTASKGVMCAPAATWQRADTWPMYQADAAHTGYRPLSLRPEAARLRWNVKLGATAVSQVAGANGRVFATLHTYFQPGPTFFGIDSATGTILWQKDYGHVFSVNPPSVFYGTVYIQTGNHSSDTYLRAYDAAGGEPVFQAPHSAQWERYLAPTIYDGKAYANGGTYGGMYGFDAFSGEQMWFSSLPQYDEWTPAVAGDLAYAYVGQYTPGLYALDRNTGRLAFVIDDADFTWNGWSMATAPTIGADNDVIGVNAGRLISFDVALKKIRWQIRAAFTGQPSVARGRIYAVEGDRVTVLDEATGAEIWSWRPPEGSPKAPVVVTDSHLLVATASRVHAVDLGTRASAWSYPVTGRLALADGNLYVSGASGELTAISMPAAGESVWHTWFAVDPLETPMVGDFNGDGLTDVITFTRQNPAAVGDVYVALSNGTHFVDKNAVPDNSDKWHDWFAITTDETIAIGDYDGDGKDDIATWLGKSTRQVYVALSYGTGMARERIWLDSIGFDPSDYILAGDVNGDARQDLLLFARKSGKVYVALSTGQGFAPPTVWHGFFAVSTYERPRVADVNGDGKADIVTFATNSPTAFGDVYVAVSDGTRFVDQAGLPDSSTKWHDWFAIDPAQQVRIGDVNGDGMDDFFTFLPPPFGQCYTVASQGIGARENVLWPEEVAPASTDVPFVGDVNGDGKADIIVFAQAEGRVRVSLAR